MKPCAAQCSGAAAEGEEGAAADGTPGSGGAAPAPRPLVVLQVLPAMHLGGVERGTLEVAKHLSAQRGVCALVASAGGPLVAQLSEHGIVHIQVPALQSKSPVDIFVRAAFCLRQIVVRHGVTVVHARSRTSAWSAWLATRGLRDRVKLVTTHHGAYGLDRAAWKRWVARVMLWSDGLILPSAFMFNFVCRHQAVRVCSSSSQSGQRGLLGRLSAERGPTPTLALRLVSLISAPLFHFSLAMCYFCPRRTSEDLRWPYAAIIPRGVDVSSFSAGPAAFSAAQKLARDWRLRRDATYVLQLGRLSPQKGALDFLQALRLLAGHAMCGDMRALLVGSNPAAASKHSRAIGEAAAQLAGGRVQIKAHVSADMVPALILSCAVVVVPSKNPGELRTPSVNPALLRHFRMRRLPTLRRRSQWS
jgi:glycosyltransferase involved in cell wall biosynthesis